MSLAAIRHQPNPAYVIDLNRQQQYYGDQQAIPTEGTSTDDEFQEVPDQRKRSGSSSAIYVNRSISKSSTVYMGMEFEGKSEAKKEDNGFFKRILNYSFKKKKQH